MLAWVDHHDADFGREVLGRLSALELRGARVEHFWTAQAPAEENDRGLRRNRIVDAWRWFLERAEAPVLLAAEDDTLPDLDAYPRLLKHLEAGAVGAQGTEVARQLPYVPHWTVGDEEICSASYDGQALVPIQGGGWYCAALVTEQARGCLAVDNGFPLGPDVVFWRELAKKGPCVGDWTVECGHFGPGFHLHPALTEIRQVVYRRSGTTWQRHEFEARPYRQAAPKTEEGLLFVRVLKPFTGTIEERQKYANPSDGLIHQGTIMEMTEARFQELGMRPNPLVVPHGSGGVGEASSLAGWAPPNTKPLAAQRTSVLTEPEVRQYLGGNEDKPLPPATPIEAAEKSETKRRK